jgi:hypothetical protein
MYSMKLDSMTIPIRFNMYHKSTTIEALLDSGCHGSAGTPLSAGESQED